MDKARILIRLLYALAVCTLILSTVSASRRGRPKPLEPSPILLFPGVAGSQLDGKFTGSIGSALGRVLTRPSKCWNRKYERVWVDIFRTPLCSRQLKLRYDKSSNTYRNASGISIRVPGFGDTDSVEYSVKINVLKIKYEKEYMKPFVDYFTTGYGYERSVSIRAAPYDWRLAADELDRTGYFNRVKGLIEEMHDVKQRKVALVAHSLGGLVSHYFLTSYKGIDQPWKDKYIKAWITLATPWAGSVKALQILLATRKTVPPKCDIKNSIFRKISTTLFSKCEWWSVLVPHGKSFESSVWLLPKPSVWEDQVLVKSEYKYKTKKYTANNYKKLFKRIGYKNGYKMFEGVQKIDSEIYPDVPTHCFYGMTNKKTTPKKISYKYGKFEIHTKSRDPIKYRKPKISYGDGDGTVNTKSLHLCITQWAHKDDFKAKKIIGVSHTKIVKHKEVLNDIACIVEAKECENLQ